LKAPVSLKQETFWVSGWQYLQVYLAHYFLGFKTLLYTNRVS